MASKRHLGGWRRDLPDHRDMHLTVVRDAASPPPPSDLRSKCPAIYDQKNIGSCVAHGAGFVWHFVEQAKEGAVETPSRLKIYYDGRVAQGTVQEDSGLTVRGGFKAIAKNGLCHEHLWPYVTSKFKLKPNMAAVQDGLKHKPTDKMYVSVKQDLTILTNVLVQRPIAFGFAVPSSFMGNDVASTGVFKMPQPGEQILGGHCVALVGYDPVHHVFYFRNSWGMWGMSGYGTMPEEFVLSQKWCSDFWTAIVAADY